MECPRCKEDMPLLSKICPVCGYVVEGRNSEIELIFRKMEDDLAAIRNLPEPTFVKSMANLSYLLFPIIATALLLLAFITSAGLFWILFLIFLILSIISIVRKSKGVLGNARFENYFNALKNRFELNERSARQSYGKNREVSNLLDEISSKIAEIEQVRRSMSRKNIIVWCFILIIMVVLSIRGVVSVNDTIQLASANEEDIEILLQENNLEKAIEIFKKNIKPSDEISLTHSTLINAMLSKDKRAEAIEFFKLYCQGNKGDFDCAAILVNYLNNNGAKKEAEEFINCCNNFRYKSDKTKLLNLISK